MKELAVKTGLLLIMCAGIQHYTHHICIAMAAAAAVLFMSYEP